MKEVKTGTKWDSELNTDPCDRYNNAELTLTLKLFVEKIDPAGATGTYPDHNGTARKIVKWGSKFNAWTSKFKRECEAFWGGKLWLKAPILCIKYVYADKTISYQPNIWCRFKIELLTSAAGAHKSIKAVRLDPTEPFFRSNDSLYDSKDLDPVPQAHGGKKKTHIHEVGHALGLPHVGVGQPSTIGGLMCTIHKVTGGSTDDSICYGVMDEEKKDVMGSGSDLHEWHAKPWQDAMELHSGLIGVFWEGVKQRYYPRDLSEILIGKWWTTKPPRS